MGLCRSGVLLNGVGEGFVTGDCRGIGVLQTFEV